MTQKLSTQVGPLNESIAHKKQGNSFLAEGRLEEAAACYRQAVAISPDYAEGYLNLGFVLNELGLYEEAIVHLKQAIRLNPKLEDAYYVLGSIEEGQGNLLSAIENYSLALELKPDVEIFYCDLCQALFQNGQLERAKKIIKQGISLNPEFADFHNYLGNLYVTEKKLEKAIGCYQKALSLRPDYVEAHSNMGKAYMDLGDLNEAISWYRKVLALDADTLATESISALLFSQSYKVDYSPAQYLLEARHYGSKLMEQAKPYTHWPVHPAGDTMLPLRVGLVSGDFNNHPVGFFLESVLAYLNPSKVELLAYHARQHEDDLTSRIKPYFVAWNSILGLSDEVAARKIYADGIHILIDLSGHTTHNRLSVFAWKPAPVQVSWLGYFASTGVPGMDYLLADPVSVTENQRESFTESIYYLPDTRLCFTPPKCSTELTPVPPPAMRNGFITFGCFQNVNKLNDFVVALWGRILRALPHSRLRLQSKQLDGLAKREELLQLLAQAGISQQRVVIEGYLPREEYLAAYADVDIILDTFPYPGGTTTCEALWMGVPTLTLAGDTLLSRQGASLLSCVGLEDWIASDEEDYISRALTHASDIEELALLRSSLRQRVLTSPLFDAPLFAQRLEDALQGIWYDASHNKTLEKHV